jgi:nucleoside-diphosphate-sugar epimerase
MAESTLSADTPYQGSSVLVTGASGFIGAHLCRRLCQSGARVTGVYLNSSAPKEEGPEWLRLDLTDLEAVREAMRTVRPDYIFHLAGSVQGRQELDAVIPTFENNLATTVNILVAAQESGCCKRLVIANSQEEPGGDDADAVPVSPYAASKFAASAYARMFNALYRFPVVMARIFMVYGPGQRDFTKLVPYTILQALNGKAPEITRGMRKIDWVYVDDLVAGLLQLAGRSGIDGQTIDLGSGQAHTIRETVEEILQQINPALEGAFGAVPERLMEREPIADSEQTMSTIGWRPEVSLPEGLARTIAWYREYGVRGSRSD